MEIPLPWSEERFHQDPHLQPIHDLFHELHDRRIFVAPMAIAPDRHYAVPDRAHLFYYHRPAQAFGALEQQTFLVPPSQIVSLAKTLLCQPEDLPQFEAYQQPHDSIRNIMVCTHGNVDISCARFGQPIYAKLRQAYASDQLRVWRCSHFGGHQFAPTLMDFPTGQTWGHLEPEILPALVKRDRPVSELRRFYRGQSGLPPLAQIVEREIWMQHGWEWLDYRKSGQILAQDSTEETKEPDWADVRLEFAAPDGHIAGTYEAKVEVCGSVMTAYNSGEVPVAVKQYQVTRLELVG